MKKIKINEDIIFVGGFIIFALSLVIVIYTIYSFFPDNQLLTARLSYYFSGDSNMFYDDVRYPHEIGETVKVNDIDDPITIIGYCYYGEVENSEVKLGQDNQTYSDIVDDYIGISYYDKYKDDRQIYTFAEKDVEGIY